MGRCVGLCCWAAPRVPTGGSRHPVGLSGPLDRGPRPILCPAHLPGGSLRLGLGPDGEPSGALFGESLKQQSSLIFDLVDVADILVALERDEHVRCKRCVLQCRTEEQISDACAVTHIEGYCMVGRVADFHDVFLSLGRPDVAPPSCTDPGLNVKPGGARTVVRRTNVRSSGGGGRNGAAGVSKLSRWRMTP